jgi:proteic killer suppression protein
MIKSFRCKDTEALFTTGRCAKFANFKKVAERKLTQLDASVILDDLKAPPGNRLEALAGDRSGQYSIRINDQFRVCFVWTDEGPADVEIVDYH